MSELVWKTLHDKELSADSVKYPGSFWLVGEDTDGSWVVELVNASDPDNSHALAVVGTSNAAVARVESEEGLTSS